MLQLPAISKQRIFTGNSRSWPFSFLATGLLLLSLCCYWFIGYGLIRTQFTLYFSCYLLLFAAYLQLLKREEMPGIRQLPALSAEQTGLLLNRKSDLPLFIAIAMAFRLSFLFSLPALSDDYFRFAWDGYLWTQGENPFTILPVNYMREGGKNMNYLLHLFNNMNSPAYYTVYPPICQFLFGSSAALFPGNLLGTVIVIRIGNIAAEAGTIFLLVKILSMLHLPVRNVLIYALNPLVIIELTGNLHPEAIMIFFLVLSVFLLLKITTATKPTDEPVSNFAQRLAHSVSSSNTSIPKNLASAHRRWLILSALSCAAAIASKLIPLLFLPMLIKRLKWRFSSLYFLITGAACMILLIPFINSQLMMQWGSSLQLYFRHFEFNAGIYYVIRWAGFQILQHDVVQQAGPWLAIITFVSIILYAAKEKETSWSSYFAAMQWSLTIYLLLATTVHPWYITTLVMCSVVTGYKYPIVWSLFIALSYATYSTIPYQENLVLTAIEYIAVLAVLISELAMRGKKQPSRLHTG